jgi:hypothetical protein
MHADVTKLNRRLLHQKKKSPRDQNVRKLLDLGPQLLARRRALLREPAAV